VNDQLIMLAIVVTSVVAVACDSAGAETFQKLAGAQIRAKFSGMEMSDGVHWSEVFDRSGVLNTFSMGSKAVGKWRVQSDEICLDRPKEESFCYEAWMSGSKVELRRKGSSLPLEGVLQKPARRN
jgi:hypothetical protein